MATGNRILSLLSLLCLATTVVWAAESAPTTAPAQPADAGSATATAPAAESTPAKPSAADPDAGQKTTAPQPDSSEPNFTLEGVSKKFERASWNVLMGWTEIPAGIDKIGSEHGMGAAATVGVAHGVGRAVQRTSVGIFEIIGIPLGITDELSKLIEPAFRSESDPKAAPTSRPTQAPEVKSEPGDGGA